ncbi:biotin-dependent carboxyltransferase family protein [Ensifer sp. ENS07]|uniref:Biotin-dependent carboxyltransferase family protein n=1 Tax=Ensifer adhaerens TaxID=106592 RepID=A0A9Q9DDP6_ENSAD|nr:MULTISPECIES: biotin-dependent carboxyltransferase family protein [Ensifer]MBD9638526.1 biotin-dependent carboxyltransferase family protein [Ensifer sp. ENS07]USJ27536.1 biotin-dependent carboxyltransferase family protein [Ensifer adhaerens]
MIEIVETGPLNTIQDLGRPGYRNIGVTASGAMDPLAMKIGNTLLGNPQGAAVLEVQTFPFRLVFAKGGAFALTGADCRAKLDGVALPPWWAAQATAGQVLELFPPLRDARAYVSLAGGVDVAEVMGSRSTSLRGSFGGLSGRTLAVGDAIVTGPVEPACLPKGGFGVVPPAAALKDVFPVDKGGALLIRALPAGEHDLFGADADRFWRQPWKISARSDRTGYRLSGDPIHPAEVVEMRSHGVVPGVIQVPPAGEPIVQMSDANTAGGYPKIAGVIEADLWRMGQARIGSTVRFVPATHAEARAIEKALAAYVEDIRNTARLVSKALAAMA